MPATSPASRSTTTCRCWSRRRRRASTHRSAPSSCGCASPTRTPRSRSAAWRSPSGCSAAATIRARRAAGASSQYLGTLATIPELESSLRQTQNALCVLLARPPGPLPEMAAGRAKIPEAPLDVIVDLPADLLRRRPDVRAAEMQLAAQSALIGVSEAALYPSIALARLGRPVGHHLRRVRRARWTGRSARRWSGTCSIMVG